MALQLPRERRRFTVDDYYKMAEVGILRPDDRVELLDGEIVQMSPIGSAHAAGVTRVTNAFYARVGDRAVIRVQNPIHLGDHSEPEPDMALLRPRAELYARAHPRPADVLLVVEVADTSAAFDRRVKLPLYACAAIPETWLLVVGAVPSRWIALEVHRDPTPDGYRQIRRLRRGQRLSPLALPNLEVSVDELLGP